MIRDPGGHRRRLQDTHPPWLRLRQRQAGMGRADVVDGPDQRQAVPQRAEVTCQRAAPTGQRRQPLAKRRIEALAIGGVDHAVLLDADLVGLHLPEILGLLDQMRLHRPFPMELSDRKSVV